MKALLLKITGEEDVKSKENVRNLNRGQGGGTNLSVVSRPRLGYYQRHLFHRLLAAESWKPVLELTVCRPQLAQS